MNILKHELYKVLSQKMLWLLITALLALNVFLYINRQNKYELPVNKEYYSMENDYGKLENSAALSKAVQTSQELSALSMTMFLQSRNTDEALIREQINNMLKAFHAQMSYEELMEKYKDSKYIKNEELLVKTAASIDLIKTQLQYINDYPSFINSMKQKAEDMKSVSIFNQPDTFAYRNIVKTLKDFEHLKGITLKIGDQNGIVSATGFEVTDLFILTLLFLLCIYLFSQEKENGLTGLIKSTRNGRLPVISAKLSVLIMMASFLSFVFYGTNLVLGNCIYGFGDMSRYIQSMSEFRDCYVLLTVRQYLLLFIIAKIIAAAFAGLVFGMFFTILSRIKSIYMASGIFLGASYLCYVFIHPISYINVLKYLNIFAFFNVFQLFASYININLFGYAVNKIYASVLVLSAVTILSILANTLAFIKLYNNSGGVLTAALRKLSLRRTRISGHVNLFLHESNKIFIGSRVGLIILFSFIIGYGTISFKPLLLDYDSSAYKSYIDKLAGKLTHEKISFIENEQRRFENIPLEIEKLNGLYKKGGITEADLAFGMNNLLLFSQNQKGFEKVKKQYEYVLSLKQKQKISGSFICELSSDYIFNNKSRDLTTGLTYAILLIMCLCGIFPNDLGNGMYSIIKCTRHGRRRLFAIKYTIGYLISLLLIFIIYLPYYINLFTRYSIGDGSAPIQSIRIFENLGFSISISGFAMLVNLLQALGALVMTGFILFISQLVKKQSFTILAATVLFVFPFLMSLMGVSDIDFFTLTNSFTLFHSFTGSKAFVFNIVYFIVLTALSLFSVVIMMPEKRTGKVVKIFLSPYKNKFKL